MQFNQTNKNAGDVVNDGVKQPKPKMKRVVTRAQLLEGFLMNWPDCPAHPGGEVVQYFYCNPICVGDEIYEVDEPTHSGGILSPVSREFVDAVPMTTNEAIAILEDAGKKDPKVREALIVFSSLQQCPERGFLEKALLLPRRQA